MLNANDIRQKTISFSCATGAGHLAPALSTVEVLTTMFNDYLKYTPGNPHDESRDRFILSKGHGAYAYYIILNQLGFLPDHELEGFNTPSASIKGCLTENPDYMIEASTGSLGHGLPIAVGMALSFKLQNKPNKVICMVGDGEMQEGSNYEAMILALRFKLDNLLIIIDANDLQAMGKVDDIGVSNDKLAVILRSFVDSPSSFFDINGHDEKAISDAFNNFYNQEHQSFSVMFARTVKGKGLSLIENSSKHHFRCPTQDGYVPKEGA
ncbi:hypothetical protein N480_01320 [Pseudoalteromonas luteoviolacea S2607]|uniref:transketolase n=1 Tax=Pseudoalteromonas luteoviolacea TaxID=43657 RepID=UPI0007B0384A|nr:transketolase [Pseudoalteromonas luteoviolacea]KZN39503.1 hypothetical protein N480_01320 [Pseudoalteromonas luteoviolacea S2607]